MRSHAYLPVIGIILLLALVQCAYALPVTGAATGVNSKNITFNAAGAVAPVCWYYGTVSGRLVWVTENQTSVIAGAANITESGVPLMSGTKYYFKACDPTGCGSELSTTLADVTPAPTTTYGATAWNIYRSHFDLGELGGNIIQPVLWVVPSAEIVFGVILFFMFTGIWIRHRELIMPVMLGMIGSGLLIYTGVNSVGIPPEFVIVVIGLVAAGLTGIVVGLFKK